MGKTIIVYKSVFFIFSGIFPAIRIKLLFSSKLGNKKSFEPNRDRVKAFKKFQAEGINRGQKSLC